MRRVTCVLLLGAEAVAVEARRRGRQPPEPRDPTVVEGVTLPADWSKAKIREIQQAAAAERRERERRVNAGLPLLLRR